MNYEKAIAITSLMYLLLFCYLIFKIKIYKKWGILFLLLVSIITPYNLLIIKISNYQIMTPFTFIYRYKIGVFSFLDIYFLGMLLYNLKNIIKVKIFGIMKILIFRDIVYIILGTLTLLLFSGYLIDYGRTYFSYLRGALYTWGGYFLFSYFLIKNKNFDSKIINSILLKLMLGSCFLSLFYKNGEVWTRFGKKVTLLSQEWGNFYIIYIFVFLFFMNKLNFKKIKILFFILILIVIMYLNSYKGNLVYLSLFLIYNSLIYKKRGLKSVILIYIFSVLAIFIGIIFIFKFKDNGAINTRKLQLKQYMKYIDEKKNSEIIYLFGSGIGAAYKGKMGDYGESYEIDRQKYGEYKFSIQTPVLSNFKEVGIIGVLFCILTNSIILFKILKNAREKKFFIEKRKKVEQLITNYFLFYNLLTLVIFVGVPSISLFTGYLYAQHSKLLGEKR